eukprot:GHVP01053964.1.p1 GENE.GHVP01053964.1~~GHVP01053964.1.p1  ORF type:complete len:231 (+),score=23.66 GHVP01053964.1:31-723(+)
MILIVLMIVLLLYIIKRTSIYRDIRNNIINNQSIHNRLYELKETDISRIFIHNAIKTEINLIDTDYFLNKGKDITSDKYIRGEGMSSYGDMRGEGMSSYGGINSSPMGDGDKYIGIPSISTPTNDQQDTDSVCTINFQNTNTKIVANSIITNNTSNGCISDTINGSISSIGQYNELSDPNRPDETDEVGKNKRKRPIIRRFRRYCFFIRKLKRKLIKMENRVDSLNTALW